MPIQKNHIKFLIWVSGIKTWNRNFFPPHSGQTSSKRNKSTQQNLKSVQNILLMSAGMRSCSPQTSRSNQRAKVRDTRGGKRSLSQSEKVMLHLYAPEKEIKKGGQKRKEKMLSITRGVIQAQYLPVTKSKPITGKASLDRQRWDSWFERSWRTQPKPQTKRRKAPSPSYWLRPEKRSDPKQGSRRAGPSTAAAPLGSCETRLRPKQAMPTGP